SPEQRSASLFTRTLRWLISDADARTLVRREIAPSAILLGAYRNYCRQVSRVLAFQESPQAFRASQRREMRPSRGNGRQSPCPRPPRSPGSVTHCFTPAL